MVASSRLAASSHCADFGRVVKYMYYCNTEPMLGDHQTKGVNRWNGRSNTASLRGHGMSGHFHDLP